jgi:ubiquinone/menaquinone biosynthesis C-methylase UbiE
VNDHGHLLPELYRMEERGGWMQGMRRITHALLAEAPQGGGLCLDVGTGGGLFAAELAAQRPTAQVIGLDRSPAALPVAWEQAAPGVALAQADVHHLPFPTSSVALATALDVLDQRAVCLPTALGELHRVLRPGGLLLLRVSAHAWLTGPHDAAFNTGRRLHRRDLRQALARAGLRTLHMTYANSLLAPPIAVMRLLQRWRLLDVTPDTAHAGWTNDLLRWALTAESWWLRHRTLPIGISLYALAACPGASPKPATF